VVDDPHVSRRHAKIVESSDGEMQVIDLESTNGTFVNGVRVNARALLNGDRVQLGGTGEAGQNGGPCGVTLKFSYQDRVEEQIQRRLWESATQDSLTGAYNRTYFRERLAHDVHHALRHNRPLSLALLDVDHFKRINDTYGHLAGDSVLKKLARVLEETTRDEDLVARWGGEEFAIIYRDADAAHGTICCERLRRVIEKTTFLCDGQSIPVTASVGLATLDRGNLPSADALVQAADEYLYAAKRNGRNRVESSLTNRPPPSAALAG
jgi:diguanylate cyclase (GGDEF)-like protein